MKSEKIVQYGTFFLIQRGQSVAARLLTPLSAFFFPQLMSKDALRLMG